jgi:hypothetical protein
MTREEVLKNRLSRVIALDVPEQKIAKKSMLVATLVILSALEGINNFNRL